MNFGIFAMNVDLHFFAQVHGLVLCSSHFENSEDQSIPIFMITKSWFGLS